MATRRKHTHADQLTARKRQAEISAQTDHAAAELRWNVFVDTMTALAAELAPERAVEPQTPTGRIEEPDRAKAFQAAIERTANSIL
jgi:hypothetical protein